MLGARPHSQDAMTNRITLPTNSRTWPKRCDSQPVSGTAIAFATAKLVMTQVPWFGLTPRLPAIAGNETLAIEVSSTFMNVAADRAIVPHIRADPSSGWSAAGIGVVPMVSLGWRRPMRQRQRQPAPVQRRDGPQGQRPSRCDRRGRSSGRSPA